MRPRNYLFSLSLLLLVGCTQQEIDHSKCEAKADSLTRTHAQDLDSLTNVIEAYQVKIIKLQDELARLGNTTKELPKNKIIIPQKRPQGDPTDDPIN